MPLLPTRTARNSFPPPRRAARLPPGGPPARFLFDVSRCGSLWCGFAVVGSRERFYFAGDTAYCPIFGQIGERYGPFDLGKVELDLQL